MLTIIALLTTFAASTWADPFAPADDVRWTVPPIDRWASYWPTHTASKAPAPAPIPQAKPAPIELHYTDPPHAGRLTTADFLSQAEAEKIHTLATELAADLVTTSATDAVIFSRAGQRIVLSAMLCDASQRLIDPRAAGQARRRAAHDLDQARERLAVLGIEALACDAYPVARLVGCLGIVPAAECTSNPELAVQVHAAEKLATP